MDKAAEHSMQAARQDMEAGAWQRMAQQAQGQDWPGGALYVVATPIGNLADLGLRAWMALRRCDVVAAEDTRATRVLLDAWGIDTPMLAAHRHNEAAAAEAIVARLRDGQRVALVSDAGSPAVSDPGARVVRAVRDAGLRVVPVPGASAVLAALMASGATSDEQPAFAFAGFPPAKSAARQAWLRPWCTLPAPVVLFEAPHRLGDTLADLCAVAGEHRIVTVARELTKRFEEIDTLTLGEAMQRLRAQAGRTRGEHVLIVHAAPPRPAAETQQDDAPVALDTLLSALAGTVTPRDAARVLAQATGLPRDVCYRRVLDHRKGSVE